MDFLILTWKLGGSWSKSCILKYIFEVMSVVAKEIVDPPFLGSPLSSGKIPIPPLLGFSVRFHPPYNKEGGGRTMPYCTHCINGIYQKSRIIKTIRGLTGFLNKRMTNCDKIWEKFRQKPIDLGLLERLCIGGWDFWFPGPAPKSLF